MASRRTTKNSTRTPEQRRLRALRRDMRDRGLDGALILNRADVQYLSGFHGEDSWAIVTARRLVIVSDSRFAEELERGDGSLTIRMRSGPIAEATANAIEDLKLDRVALQTEHTTLAVRKGLAKRLGARRLVGADDLVSPLRVIKDETEVRRIAEAAGIQEDALHATLERIGPRMTEMEVAAILEFEMKRRGSTVPAFPTIAAARANGSLPHAVPGTTRTASRQPLLLDWGATSGGYRSDMTRTFAFKTWPPALREVYYVVLEAQMTALDRIRAGVRASDVDRAARDVIEHAGYGDCFGHGLGHGVGLEVHEAPRLSRTSSDTLEPGMVVTVEPGVYLPGLGGVRIEDLVVVTDRGCRNLSTLPKDLDWATR